jgi:PAS domain-containing protein
LADEASRLLALTARLHMARGDANVWREVLLQQRDTSGCVGVLDLADDALLAGPDELEALAGRLSHCSGFGDACGDTRPGTRERCAAFALHVHAAAVAARKSLQASLFDHLPATWIVDRSTRVRDANAAARALTRAGERFALVAGILKPLAPGAATQLRNALLLVSDESRLLCKDGHGGETTLLLRALPEQDAVAITLQVEPSGWAEVAERLAKQLGLTPRRSELGAHLLAGHSVTDAAGLMGISRHTANEHLSALLEQAKVPDRKALLVLLRRIVQR